MRIKLHLSPAREIVPFNHLPVLAGALHKWLGPNEEHGELSLYSFSWLIGGRHTPTGLDFSRGARWHISALDHEFLATGIIGIMRDTEVRWGMRVVNADIMRPPIFPDGISEQRFLVNSPILIKRQVPNPDKPKGFEEKHFLYSDPMSDALLTETLMYKLSAAGMNNTGLSVRFDREYPKAKSQKVMYRDIGNMCSYCPVYIRGRAEQLAFAWTVGLGNSTGIGFGSLFWEGEVEKKGEHR